MTHPTHGLDPNALEAALRYARPLLVKYAYTQGNNADFVREITKPVDDALAALSQNPGTSNTSGEAGHDVRALNNRLTDLLLVGNRLSFAAQTTGGTAGRDDELVQRIAEWKVEAEKAKAIQRIVKYEPALEPRASDREAVIEEIENAMLWFAHPLTDRKVLRFKAEQTAAAIRKLSEVSHEH